MDADILFLITIFGIMGFIGILGLMFVSDFSLLSFLEGLYEIISRIICDIGKLLYTISLKPFILINNNINNRRKNKEKFQKELLDKQIELEKLKMKNWENGVL